MKHQSIETSVPDHPPASGPGAAVAAPPRAVVAIESLDRGDALRHDLRRARRHDRAARPDARCGRGQFRSRQTQEICDRLNRRGWTQVQTGDWQGELVMGISFAGRPRERLGRSADRSPDRGGVRSPDRLDPPVVTRLW